MLDVHPPEHAAHTWRDFFIHIGTIVVGLLIAIGLEQSIEWMHRRHLLHQAEASLHVEFEDNKRFLARDEQQLDVTEANLQLLMEHRSHQSLTGTGALKMHWEWDDMQSNAWETVRSNGAVALMSYEQAQTYGSIYGQQALVNEQATMFVRGIYHSQAGLQGRPETADSLLALTPEETNTMIAATQQSLVDLQYVRDLCESLDRINRRSEPAI